MLASFKQKLPIAKNIFTFQFQPPGKVKFTPGQYTRLYLPHPSADERGERHFFTVSASPTEDHLAITTKFSEPSSTFKQTLAKLKPGAEVEMAEPKGDFVLPEDRNRPLVFVAGGIGVTPYRSILKYLKDSNQSRSIQLLYGASEPGQIAFRALFDSLPWLKTTYLVGQLDANWQGIVGQLDGPRIKELAGGFDNKLIYLSGPEPMVEAFEKQLLELKLPPDQIKTDFFPGYTKI